MDFSGGGGGRGRSSSDWDVDAMLSLAGAGGADVGGISAVDPLLLSSFSEGGFELRDIARYAIFVGLSIEFLRRSSGGALSSTAEGLARSWEDQVLQRLKLRKAEMGVDFL